MIVIQDDFLEKQTFQNLQQYCFSNKFKITKVGEKEFSVLDTPEYMIPFLQIDGHRLLFTFIRSAYKGFDTDLRIHADNIINGEKTALATVLYINGDEVSTNGTAFYKHLHYGRELPIDITNKEFDLLITQDSNDSAKWVKKDIVIGEPNRLLLYNSNYFHSKFPSEIDRGVRMVLVAFYVKENS